jgi:hypothetical protein
MAITWKRINGKDVEGEAVTHRGLVIGTVGRNEQVMSDMWEFFNYAIVWDVAEGHPREINVGSPGIGAYTLAEVEVDASVAIQALADAYDAAREESGQAKAALAYADEEARLDVEDWGEVEKGKVMVVARGRKVAKGTTGKVVWYGPSKGSYGGIRAGIATDDERDASGRHVNVVFVDAKHLDNAEPFPAARRDELDAEIRAAELRLAKANLKIEAFKGTDVGALPPTTHEHVIVEGRHGIRQYEVVEAGKVEARRAEAKADAEAHAKRDAEEWARIQAKAEADKAAKKAAAEAVEEPGERALACDPLPEADKADIAAEAEAEVDRGIGGYAVAVGAGAGFVCDDCADDDDRANGQRVEAVADADPVSCEVCGRRARVETPTVEATPGAEAVAIVMAGVRRVYRDRTAALQADLDALAF